MSDRSRQHRYEEIADLIRASISRGAYHPDGRLPSERNLVQKFEAQRKTVRQALSLLEREGRIESVGKSGWFVTTAFPSGRPEAGDRKVLFVTFRRRTIPSADTIAYGLRDGLESHGLQVMRFDSSSHEEWKHIETIEDLSAVQPAGIAMWPHGPVDAQFLIRLQSAAPLVLVDRRVFGFEADSVRFDDRGGGRIVTEHLLANGHRKIAFLGDEPFVESVQNRWYGYRQALETANIEPDDRLTVITYGAHQPVFGATLKALLVDHPSPPTAVVCSNDGVASQLILACRELGIRVPEDLAITGFGNGNPTYLDVMGLTSVNQPFIQLGKAAAKLLLNRITRSSGPTSGFEEVLIPMELVVRSSSSSSVHVG